MEDYASISFGSISIDKTTDGHIRIIDHEPNIGKTTEVILTPAEQVWFHGVLAGAITQRSVTE